MFKKMLVGIIGFLLLTVAMLAQAKVDSLIKVANPNLDNIAPTVQRGNRLDTGLNAQIMNIGVKDQTYISTPATSNEKVFPKSAWLIACGLGFISVIKRRLNR